MKDITNSKIVTHSSNYKGSVRSFTQMFVYNMRRSLYVLNKVDEPRYTETKKWVVLRTYVCNTSFLMCIFRKSILNMLEKVPRSPVVRHLYISRCLPTLKVILVYLKPFYKSLMLFLINQENQDIFKWEWTTRINQTQRSKH